jgi:hypothetical protein
VTGRLDRVTLEYLAERPPNGNPLGPADLGVGLRRVEENGERNGVSNGIRGME